MKNGIHIDDFNNVFYYKNGELHREDGPAIEYADGSEFWYYEGKYHREDGPALKWNTGSCVWYYHGKYMYVNSQEEFEQILRLKFFW